MFSRKHRVDLNADPAIERACACGRRESFSSANFHRCTERQWFETASARSDNPQPEHRRVTHSLLFGHLRLYREVIPLQPQDDRIGQIKALHDGIARSGPAGIIGLDEALREDDP